MTTCYLSPIFNEQQFDNNGLPLNGGKIYWYEAGTATTSRPFTDWLGVTVHAQPVVLDASGRPTSPIWLQEGLMYKAILKDADDNTLQTVDNVVGVNDGLYGVATDGIKRWIPGSTPTYVTTKRFTVVGDQSSTYHVGRRIKATCTAGVLYGTIYYVDYNTTSAGNTTVKVSLDSGNLDSGLSAVSYGFIGAVNTSIPMLSPKPNYFDNPRFNIAQRVIASGTSGRSFICDRWPVVSGGSTYVITKPTASPVFVSGQGFGGEIEDYLQIAVTSSAGASNYVYLSQDVFQPADFANGDVVISGLVKNTSGSDQTMLVSMHRYYGSGGSTTVDYSLGLVTVGTTWTYFAVPCTLPVDAPGIINQPNYITVKFWLDAGASTYGASVGQKSVTWQFGGLKLERGLIPTQDVPLPIALQYARCNWAYQQLYAGFSADVTSGRTYNQWINPVPMHVPGVYYGAGAPTLSETNVSNTNMAASSTLTWVGSATGYGAIKIARAATGTGQGSYETNIKMDWGY